MTAPFTRADSKSVLRLAAHPPVREARFWIIQGAVLLIAGLHLALDLHDSVEIGAFPSGVPVALLILPVGYAALRYALAGAAATTALAILLWLPDLLLPRDRGHVGGDLVELTLIVIVAFVFGRRIDAERFAHVRTERALAKALDIETRYHRLFETIRSPMLALDREGIVTDANPAATKLLGDDVVGQRGITLLNADVSLDAQVGRVISLADGHEICTTSPCSSSSSWLDASRAWGRYRGSRPWSRRGSPRPTTSHSMPPGGCGPWRGTCARPPWTSWVSSRPCRAWWRISKTETTRPRNSGSAAPRFVFTPRSNSDRSASFKRRHAMPCDTRGRVI